MALACFVRQGTGDYWSKSVQICESSYTRNDDCILILFTGSLVSSYQRDPSSRLEPIQGTTRASSSSPTSLSSRADFLVLPELK